jgi:3',5'-cyclic AMP phosphodiesterase CpdA
MINRRYFLRAASLTGTAGLLGSTTCTQTKESSKGNAPVFKPIKFGIIADIHRDLTPGVDERLEAFMKKVETEKPDFIMSLGDFAHAIPENESFAKRFTGTNVPAYHVLGNHEMDKVSKDEAAAFLGMPAPFYSFDIGGYHCVVMDPNFIHDEGKFIDYEKANYFQFGNRVSYVSDEHCDWLEADLKKTHLPTILFSHQSLLHDDIGISGVGGIPNRAYVQRILEKENERSGFTKIVAAFNGHHHLDHYRRINNIHYFSINSASYLWHNQAVSGRYPEELSAKYEYLDNMAIYKDSLFCFVTIDAAGKLLLRGVRSDWLVPPAPNSPSQSIRYGNEATPFISDRNVELA